MNNLYITTACENGADLAKGLDDPVTLTETDKNRLYPVNE